MGDCLMCFGDGGSSRRLAEQSRADEVARQNRIRQGMAQIAAVFDGTPMPDFSVRSPVSQRGEDFADVFSGLFGRQIGQGGEAGAAPAPQPTATGGGFNEAFFQKRAKDYVDYATPQLERQAADARKQLIFSLSRGGNLSSSAGFDKNADLDRDVNEQRIGVANEGLNQANQARTQVENLRSNVVSELNATGDDSAAAAAAIRNASNLNAPVGFSPLGNLFQSFTNTLSAIGSNPGNNFSGFTGGRALFGGNSRGSQRVVGG
jgi:hypothetical protein